MCGITAYFEYRAAKQYQNGDLVQQRAALAAKLNESIKCQQHRGPDSEGTWISPDTSIGLAHVRLSTRDLSEAGHQPLHSPIDDDIHCIVNGELYYDTSLRDDLGHEYPFKSTSDSEMVIPLYKRYGKDFIHRLRGEFSLVIYDGRNQTMIIARDRFGVKPLHFAILDNKLLVATQCKGIAKLMQHDSPLEWDLTCLAQGGGHYGSRTLFKGISKVPVGHMAIVRYGQTNPVTFEPYWRVKYRAEGGVKDSRSAEELTLEARKLLLEAVRLRLEMTDVQVGILLSGGVDSSAVAGMAAHLARKRLESSDGKAPPVPTCFTIAFPDDDDLDESSIAKRTADHLDLPIEKIVVTEDLLVNEFDESCWLNENLMWDLQHIAKKALSRHISNTAGLKVVLNGDGGDESFGGYPFFVLDRLIQDDSLRDDRLCSATSQDRKALKEQISKSTTWFGKKEAPTGSSAEYISTLNLPPFFSKLAVAWYQDWLNEEVRNLSNPFKGIYDCFTQEEVQEMKAYHPMRRAMLAWNKTVLPNVVISAISDGAEMAHGVESRPPFLDHVVAEFANSLPVDMLVHLDGDRDANEKWLFREAVQPFVTDEVYKRRKKTFAAPFRWQVDGPMHRKMASLINRESLRPMGFVDCEKALDMLRKSFEEKDEFFFRNVLWLAQIVSIGQQFGVRPWMPGEQ